MISWLQLCLCITQMNTLSYICSRLTQIATEYYINLDQPICPGSSRESRTPFSLENLAVELSLAIKFDTLYVRWYC